MAVAQLDLPQLASFCAVPESSISSLLDAPTQELVQTFLESVTKKIQEYNQVTSEKLKLDVELENAVRGGETKARILKNTVDKTQRENLDLRQKLENEASAREGVVTELESLKTSTSSNTSEVSSLQSRIASLETSNRDTLSLLESKTTAYDKLIEDLNSQHQKTVDLRRQLSELEQAVQSANTASSNAKFHEQGLQQEIEQLKRSNDWLDRELKAKSDEYSRFRKEKSLRITELQRENEDASAEVESLRRSENAMRRRLDELGEKADDAFQHIQQLEETAARKEESFKIELDAANRLQALTKKSAETEHQRQQDLSAELENVREEMAEQSGRLAAEIETEHQEKEAAETRIAELEVQIERLQGEVSGLQGRQQELASSHAGMNGFSPRTPGRSGSPVTAFSPGSSRLKGGLSMTQLYSNYSDISRKLDAEKRRNEELVATVDGMIQEMELRGPEIEETRAEKGRLESEVAEISSLIDTISQERDQAVKTAKRWEGHVKAKTTEGDVLRQQLRDLSSQIKVLLMEAHLRTQGVDELGLEERSRLERIADGHFEEERGEGETATARLISENLVTFKSVSELQDQNTNLLKITREVGERMEHEESLRKQTEAARDWDDLQQKYERCKDEIKSLATQSQSYIRERDMFRRMLAHRGQIPGGVESMFDESVNDEGDGRASSRLEVRKSIEDGPSSQDRADYAKVLKEFQIHFYSYKQEAEVDKRVLREQIDSISKDNSRLRSEAAKSNSQVSLAHERYEMLQANYAMLRTENSELQKRAQTHSENAAKQDLRVQQVAEDLVESKGLADSLRNETANLKAEKDFWRTIEKRINEDNKNLLDERNRLNSLNASLQNVLNEREHSESETRRRLQSHMESLEKELQTTKSRLDEEVESNKRAVQRREFDNEKNQKRIDDLMVNHSTLREELVGATTTRDHLSSRVDELTIQLRSAEERLAVLQSTPNPPNSSGLAATQQMLPEGEHSSVSREQELSVQISELKRDLDLSRTDLASSKTQIQQYKAISQASEEELASLNETQDLYREETEKALTQKDSLIKELEQRIEDVLTELSSTSTELAQLRDEQAESNRRLDEHKAAFEVELAKVQDEDERHAAAAQYYQEDLKVQADIAQQAQQNYENELLKHADAAKALQKVRTEFNNVKLELVEAKTDLETARASFAQSEESWADSRDRFGGEISELKTAREGLRTQNDNLHQQLESFSQRTQQPSLSMPDQNVDISTDSGLEALQQVITYLRREKEIVDIQFEIKSQEAERLRQELSYNRNQLDETRLKLNQQRRLEAENERVALDHSKLMETINDLNTLRESNVTLRAESRQAQASLQLRSKELDDMRSQLQPLETQIRDLTVKCETQEGEAKLQKENSDRWQQRAQNVLQKYDRIDPAELEALKEQLKAAETERNEVNAAKQALQEQVDSASAQITQAQEQANERLESMKTRLTEQFKGRSKQLTERIKEKDAALQTTINERQELEQRLGNVSELQSQLETAKAEREAALQQASSGSSGTQPQADSEIEEGQVGGQSMIDSAELEDVRQKLAEANNRVQQEGTESSRLRGDLQEAQAKVVDLELQMKSKDQSIDALNAELRQLRHVQQEATSSSEGAANQIKALQEDLNKSQEEIQKLKTAASVSTSLANAPQESGEKSLAEQVAEHVEAVRIELESNHKEKIRQTEELLEKRTKQMKEGLTKKLTEGKAQIRQSLQEEHEQALQALRDAHQKEIVAMESQHNEEVAELRRQGEAKAAELVTSNQSTKTAQDEIDAIIAKSEAKNPTPSWRPSEQEIRSLVQSSDVLRGILKNNVIKQVNKAKEELTNQLKEEHNKDIIQQLAEAQTKADAAKEHAVALESKKTSLQINMQSNKAKLAQAKLDVVQKAAQETPQKRVVEVWDHAKNVKPSTGPGQVVQPQSLPTVTATFGRPSPASQPTNPTSIQNQQPPTFGVPQNQPPGATTLGRPTLPTQALKVNQAAMSARPSSTSPVNSLQQQAQPQALSQAQAVSNLPQAPVPLPAGSQPAAGVNSAGPRGPPSGLPIARGGSTRGGGARGNPRGRGSGIPRGGPQAIDTNRVQGIGPGRGSPTSALNPGAKQFMPGNKRPREDSEGGTGGDGKRIRGGAGEGDANP